MISFTFSSTDFAMNPSPPAKIRHRHKAHVTAYM